MSRREAAEQALCQVVRAVLRAGACRFTPSLGADGGAPHVAIPVPLGGREEHEAVALAMDAGVVQLRTLAGVERGGGIVSGIVPVDDVPAPAAVDVRVEVVFGPPTVLVPAQREPEWTESGGGDALYDARREDALETGVRS